MPTATHPMRICRRCGGRFPGLGVERDGQVYRCDRCAAGPKRMLPRLLVRMAPIAAALMGSGALLGRAWACRSPEDAEGHHGMSWDAAKARIAGRHTQNTPGGRDGAQAVARRGHPFVFRAVEERASLGRESQSITRCHRTSTTSWPEHDAGVIAVRAMGELAARCDMEEANFLVVNRVHEIATGVRSVKEARQFYAEALRDNTHMEYLQGFRFQVLRTPHGDSDQVVVVQR